MCGIAGTLSFEGTPDLGLIKRMVSRVHHRGPDGSGIYRDGRAALGHARLAIIDATGGAQPMTNEDESVWVTFNGEIFNYLELRRELTGLGHRFRSASDTEVIVHAWEQWGERCFRRFNGQWALGIWEPAKQQLTLSRDRLGVRPLFFARRPHRFLFASEVKALFADPEVPRCIDRAGLTETLTFWGTVAPRTIFTGIQQLPPGHVAIIREGSEKIYPYWRPQFPVQDHESLQDLATNAASLREQLIQAVRLRFLRSDVPVGAYLSGGIDSAVIAAVIVRYTDVPLETFSLRFKDSEFDEGSFQKLMARELGTTHHEVSVDARDIGASFPQVVWHTETPVLRAAPAPMFLLSRLVREHDYKVVVTGEGADEVFAGYDIFREARAREFIARDPQSPVRARALDLLYPWMARAPGQTPAFAREFFGRHLDIHDPTFSHRPRWESTASLLGMMVPHPEVGGDVTGDLVARLPEEHRQWTSLSRAQYLEMTTLLAGYILSSQGDRMLMANSVEGRFPFLDHGVVEFANRLPSRHKLLGLDEKHILKKTFRDLLPSAIIDRPKQPYRAPDAASFFVEGGLDWVQEMTTPSAVAAAGVFRPEAVRALMAKAHRSAGVRMSNTDNMRVLAVLSTQLLHHHFIEGNGSSGSDFIEADPTILVDRSPRP